MKTAKITVYVVKKDKKFFKKGGYLRQSQFVDNPLLASTYATLQNASFAISSHPDKYTLRGAKVVEVTADYWLRQVPKTAKKRKPNKWVVGVLNKKDYFACSLASPCGTFAWTVHSASQYKNKKDAENRLKRIKARLEELESKVLGRMKKWERNFWKKEIKEYRAFLRHAEVMRESRVRAHQRKCGKKVG